MCEFVGGVWDEDGDEDWGRDEGWDEDGDEDGGRGGDAGDGGDCVQDEFDFEFEFGDYAAHGAVCWACWAADDAWW